VLFMTSEPQPLVAPSSPSSLPINPAASSAATTPPLRDALPISDELVHAQCEHQDASYADVPFTVTIGTFTASPASGPVGTQITVQSDDTCPGSRNVKMSKAADSQPQDATFSPSSLPINPDGSWG